MGCLSVSHSQVAIAPSHPKIVRAPLVVDNQGGSGRMTEVQRAW